MAICTLLCGIFLGLFQLSVVLPIINYFDKLLYFKKKNLQISVGVDGKKLEPESNVLLASIENMQYAVTLDVLQTVCQ